MNMIQQLFDRGRGVDYAAVCGKTSVETLPVSAGVLAGSNAPVLAEVGGGK